MPKLTDPEEFAIIRAMYFKDRSGKDEIDPLERLDRMHSRRTINKR